MKRIARTPVRSGAAVIAAAFALFSAVPTGADDDSKGRAAKTTRTALKAKAGEPARERMTRQQQELVNAEVRALASEQLQVRFSQKARADVYAAHGRPADAQEKTADAGDRL